MTGRSRRRVAVLTTGRADYGLLYWLLRAVVDDPDLELLLYVTGSHLAPAFGHTVAAIEADGVPIARRVAILEDGPAPADTPGAAAQAMARALTGFSDALAGDRPDVLVLLGDRYEIVPVALACVLHGVPIAHLHGGETTAGALDDLFRHAVTKLATWHFAATEAYRRRIVQMGEAPERVFCFGAPGLDHLHRTPLLSRAELAARLGLPLDAPTALVTYHPVTAEPGRAVAQVDALLAALAAEAPLQAVCTKANADPEGRAINARLEAFGRAHPERVRVVDDLGTLGYLSALAHLELVVGNSSSALIEAPSFARPAVNVGRRQAGRERARNVIDVGNDVEDVRRGIRLARSEAFRASLRGMTNPYAGAGDGRVSERIVARLKRLLAEPAPAGKPFVDLGATGQEGTAHA